MGKYQLMRKLATGGMAEVFLAKSSGPLGFEKHLVVKRILPHLAEDPQFVEMFLAEAKLAARLNHANIVQIFDFGMEGGSYFIAMEYVDGVDLRTLKRRAKHQGTSIAFPLCARLLSMACEGLAYAHELVDSATGQPLNLIHRDISPDNIFVSKTGGLKILDFGIAKATTAGLRTQSGVLKGKVPYMPPEYLLGEPIDARTDIYALGVVLFELVAGRRPYRSDNDARLIQAVLNEPLPDIRDLRQGVPEQLVQILSRALAKHPHRRYGSCREFHADLERFLYLYSEPVGAIQIAAFVREMSGPLPPEAANESVPTTPEPRLLLENNEMEAPKSVVTRRDRTPGASKPPVEAPSPPPEVTEVETKQVTVPVTAPLPAPPPPRAATPLPRARPLPATREEEAVPSPRPAEPRSPAVVPKPAQPVSKPHPTVARPAPVAKAPPAARPLPPARARAVTEGDEEAFRPQQGWMQRNLKWWAPAALGFLTLGVASAVVGNNKPPAKSPAPAEPVATAPAPQPVAREPEVAVEQVPTPAPATAAPTSAGSSESPIPLEADAGVTSASHLAEAPEPAPSTQVANAADARAVIRVKSNLSGEVTINNIRLGKPPVEYTVAPGAVRISVGGIHQGHRFSRKQTVKLAANEKLDIDFQFEKRKVILRPRNDELLVQKMDDIMVNGHTEVSTYEGEHHLTLQHSRTKETFSARCTPEKTFKVWLCKP
ncbi:protein kinase [Pyxidicoccus fallax]|uniref:Protein kinase n=1 Tax=Pyxidicoccus fallax TaxID=394095 RepID=A0A848LJW2_9BACT|nr:serine/threonine-protein kinase [Pyxidicoccus fallax]NMO18047.1 protein kinase [Pyxidicoccus fallax]NPC78603.1 protein kinase [Pyxidicoccus fallax]